MNKHPLQSTELFVFFWDGWPSQWHRSPFVCADIEYSCAEQYMMAQKARIFGDVRAEAAIMATTSPRAQKSLGREVTGFVMETWEAVCRAIVFAGNLAKFQQNDELADLLLATGDRIIVEASPFDRIWGIGLKAEDPRALDPATWQGRNWLGIALMQVRETLRSGHPAKGPDSAELIAQLGRLRAMGHRGVSEHLPMTLRDPAGSGPDPAGLETPSSAQASHQLPGSSPDAVEG